MDLADTWHCARGQPWPAFGKRRLHDSRGWVSLQQACAALTITTYIFGVNEVDERHFARFQRTIGQAWSSSGVHAFAIHSKPDGTSYSNVEAVNPDRTRRTCHTLDRSAWAAHTQALLPQTKTSSKYPDVAGRRKTALPSTICVPAQCARRLQKRARLQQRSSRVGPQIM